MFNIRQFLANLSETQRRVLTFSSIAIVVIIIFSVIFMILTAPKIVKIQNLDQYMSSANGNEKWTLQRNLYVFLAQHFGEDVDPEDIYIRDGTYKESFEDGHNVADFIIDIDSLKISYEVSFAFPLNELTSQNPVIDCPKLSEMKYRNTDCVGMYNSTQSLKSEQKNPIYKVLPIIVDTVNEETKLPVRYEVRGFFDMDNNYNFVVNIMDYTGGNYENALQDIREAGFNPEDYTVNYIDKTVYQFLPYEGTNSLGDKFTINYTYDYTVVPEGVPYFSINNYSCSDNTTASEEATIKAVESWFLGHGSSLDSYEHGVLTFCQSV